MPEISDISNQEMEIIVSSRKVRGRKRRIAFASILSAALVCGFVFSPFDAGTWSLPVTDNAQGASDEYSQISESMEKQASSPAEKALDSAGIKTAMVVPIAEKTVPEQGNYCVPFFPEDDWGNIAPDAKDIILAVIASDGTVSFDSFARVVASLPGHQEVEATLEVFKTRKDLDGICNTIADITGYAVPCYAAIDNGYATELRNGIAEIEPKSIRTNVETERNNEALDVHTVIKDSLWYNQNDYKGYYYQDEYDIPEYGCGVCSTAVALDMLLDVKWDPIYVSRHMESWADENGGIQYCGGAGTAYEEWMQTVSGTFGVNVRRAASIDDVRDSLRSGNMIVSGNGGGVFKSQDGATNYHGGHIICFYKYEDGAFWAKDSAGNGGPSVRYSEEDFSNWWASGSFRTFVISR